MKKLLITTIFIILLSCNKPAENIQEIESLRKKISVLEVQNRKLKDLLSKSEEDFLKSLLLIGIPEQPILKAGRKSRIVMLLQTYDRTLPQYEIYRVENGKEIKIGENNKTRFDFEFTPKSTEDYQPELFIKLQYNGKTFKFPAKLILIVKK